MIKTNLALAMAAGLAAPLLLGPAAPAKADPSARLWVQSIDANGDGVLARSELRRHRVDSFYAWDENNNGVIDIGDLESLGGPAVTARIFANLCAAHDADRDGVVSFDELADGPTPTFDRFDADRDGALSGAELEAFVLSARTRRSESGGGSAGPSS